MLFTVLVYNFVVKMANFLGTAKIDKQVKIFKKIKIKISVIINTKSSIVAKLTPHWN